MDYIFTITDHTSSFQTGFAAVISCWILGWVIGQVVHLTRTA
ncbi:TPA: hypothetical protein ACN31Q_000455 [Vibrio campbellii]